jgi:hypothetical protein
MRVANLARAGIAGIGTIRTRFVAGSPDAR